MNSYYTSQPSSSRALIRLAPSSTCLSDDDDTASIITASSINPGSSVSSRSASTRASGSGSGSGSGSRRSAPSHSSRSSISSAASTRSSSYTFATTSSGPAPHDVHVFRRGDGEARSFFSDPGRSAGPGSRRGRMVASAPGGAAGGAAGYDDWLMAVYLTELLDVQRQPAGPVKQFLGESASFRPTGIGRHLDAMTEEAFGLFRKQVQHTHRKMVDAMKSGRDSYGVGPVMSSIDEEWERWRPSGRGRAGRRASVMSCEESLSRFPSGQMTYTRTISFTQ